MFQNITDALSSVFIEKIIVFVIELRDLLAVNSISTFRIENVSREN